MKYTQSFQCHEKSLNILFKGEWEIIHNINSYSSIFILLESLNQSFFDRIYVCDNNVQSCTYLKPLESDNDEWVRMSLLYSENDDDVSVERVRKFALTLNVIEYLKHEGTDKYKNFAKILLESPLLTRCLILYFAVIEVLARRESLLQDKDIFELFINSLKDEILKSHGLEELTIDKSLLNHLMELVWQLDAVNDIENISESVKDEFKDMFVDASCVDMLIQFSISASHLSGRGVLKQDDMIKEALSAQPSMLITVKNHIFKFFEHLLTLIHNYHAEPHQEKSRPMIFLEGLIHDINKDVVDKLALNTPQKVMFIFPGNTTNHHTGEGYNKHAFEIKKGSGLAKVAEWWGRAGYPTFSLPTTGMEQLGDINQQKAYAQKALQSLYLAVGQGYQLILPVREFSHQYFSIKLHDSQNEPNFWGGIQRRKNIELADYYVESLNDLEKFIKIIASNSKEHTDIEWLDNFKKSHPEFYNAYYNPSNELLSAQLSNHISSTHAQLKDFNWDIEGLKNQFIEQRKEQMNGESFKFFRRSGLSDKQLDSMGFDEIIKYARKGTPYYSGNRSHQILMKLNVLDASKALTQSFKERFPEFTGLLEEGFLNLSK